MQKQFNSRNDNLVMFLFILVSRKFEYKNTIVVHNSLVTSIYLFRSLVPSEKISAEAGEVCCIRKKVWWSEQHRQRCRHADLVGDSNPYVQVSF